MQTLLRIYWWILEFRELFLMQSEADEIEFHWNAKKEKKKKAARLSLCRPNNIKLCFKI